MARLTFLEPDGNERIIEAQAGSSVMETAVKHSVAGIIAECGGNCACGTCRVYVREPWQSIIGHPAELEQSMLDYIGTPEPDLRLSCQIEVTEELSGMVVSVSPVQR